MLTHQDFIDMSCMNDVNAALITRLPDLGLNECYLTAGSLFQTIWNLRMRRRPTENIKDYDIFYFDEDLSWTTENDVIKRAEHAFKDLNARIELRNQARVHCWYEKRFGHKITPFQTTRDGIDSFLIACTCVGINVDTKALYAPNGLGDLWDGILDINPINPKPDLFKAKASDYLSRWPWLTLRA